ncbi:MAG: methylmalonyl-CoA carboxyltransferase, partial [Flavobacteriia bacterium]|nr:methylmalonyl-CoA carboxyltransferase [Flavobacteriia bacterium]
MAQKKAIQRLQDLREEAMQGGGSKRIEAQHAKGKLTARERLDVLFDPGSFEELGQMVTH